MRLRSAAIASARACASRERFAVEHDVGAVRSVAFTFTNGVVTGMTMVAGMASRAA